MRQIDPTGLYHVMSRGNYKQRIFFDELHFRRYADLLTRVADRRDWLVLDWCLMPNHYHLLIRLQDGGLSEGMRELNGCFSRWSNRQTGRTGTGHLVRNRFLGVDVIRDGHLWNTISYIPLNPVRAGLTERPEQWRWSGYRATLGLEHPFAFHRPNELLRLFGDRREEAIRRYRRHVLEALVSDSHQVWSDDVVESLG